MVSRLTTQKGFDLLKKALPKLLSRNLQLIVLGTGDSNYQKFLVRAAARYQGKLAVRIVFDEPSAHKIIAGADLFLMPSRYEPCGLTQMYSLKYGTIPVVRATGGLKDTVQEFDPGTGSGNGFLFSAYRVRDLREAVDRALELFSRKTQWRSLMRNAMAADFSWDKSAQAYLDLYQKLAGG